MTKNKSLDSPTEEQIDFIMKAITPTFGDPTFGVLKAHLLVEEYLSEYLDSKVIAPQCLGAARLSFAQKLALARALPPRWNDGQTWDRLSKLNSLRNELAHKLDSPRLKEKMNEFIEFVESIGVPIPEPTMRHPVGGKPPEGGPWYTRLDMALIATCAVASLILGMDARGELPPTSPSGRSP